VKKIFSLALCLMLIFGASYDSLRFPPLLSEAKAADSLYQISGNSPLKENPAAMFQGFGAEEDTIYYFNALNEYQRQIYRRMRRAVLNYEPYTTVDMSITGQDLQLFSTLLFYYDPAVYNFKDIGASIQPGATAIYFDYTYTAEEYRRRRDAVEKAVQDIIAKIPAGSSEYDKIRFVHDEIINNCVYDFDAPDSANPYGALVLGKAKCDGYTKAFSLVLGRLGIKTAIVVGDYLPDQTAHVWSKVEYQGKWYNVDVTYNAPISIMKNNLRHSYFMVSDECIKDTHTELKLTLPAPAANDASMSYYKLSGAYSESYEQTKKVLQSALLNASKEKSHSVAVQFTSKKEYNNALTRLFDDKEINGILAEVNQKAPNKFVPNISLKSVSESRNVIKIFVFYPDTPLSDYYKDPEKVNEVTKRTLARHGIT